MKKNLLLPTFFALAFGFTACTEEEPPAEPEASSPPAEEPAPEPEAPAPPAEKPMTEPAPPAPKPEAKPAPPAPKPEAKPKSAPKPEPATPAEPSGPNVQTLNYPLYYMASRIVGNTAVVQFPMNEDGDPAFWDPGDDALDAMQDSDLILANGATYSKWRDGVTLPGSRLVETAAGFKDQFIEIKEATTHSHGTSGEHSHAGTAFTTWLDFSLAAQQAEAAAEALKEVGAKTEGLAALKADLQKLHKAMQASAGKIGDQPLMASHPVYQYLARAYNLNIASVLWEPETVPDDEAMAELTETLKEHKAKWMIWEGEPNPESVQKLKAMGIESIVFDPSGNRPDEGDFLSVMQQNLKNLEVLHAE